MFKKRKNKHRKCPEDWQNRFSKAKNKEATLMRVARSETGEELNRLSGLSLRGRDTMAMESRDKQSLTLGTPGRGTPHKEDEFP